MAANAREQRRIAHRLEEIAGDIRDLLEDDPEGVFIGDERAYVEVAMRALKRKSIDIFERARVEEGKE